MEVPHACVTRSLALIVMASSPTVLLGQQKLENPRKSQSFVSEVDVSDPSGRLEFESCVEVTYDEVNFQPRAGSPADR